MEIYMDEFPDYDFSGEDYEKDNLPFEPRGEYAKRLNKAGAPTPSAKAVQKDSGRGRSNATAEQRAIGEALASIMRDAGIEVVTDSRAMREAMEGESSDENNADIAMMSAAKKKPYTLPASSKNAAPTIGEEFPRAKVEISDENRKIINKNLGALPRLFHLNLLKFLI